MTLLDFMGEKGRMKLDFTQEQLDEIEAGVPELTNDHDDEDAAWLLRSNGTTWRIEDADGTVVARSGDTSMTWRRSYSFGRHFCNSLFLVPGLVARIRWLRNDKNAGLQGILDRSLRNEKDLGDRVRELETEKQCWDSVLEDLGFDGETTHQAVKESLDELRGYEDKLVEAEKRIDELEKESVRLTDLLASRLKQEAVLERVESMVRVLYEGA